MVVRVATPVSSALVKLAEVLVAYKVSPPPNTPVRSVTPALIMLLLPTNTALLRI